MRVSLQPFKRKLNDDDDHPFAGNPHGMSGVDEQSSILEMNHFRLEEKKGECYEFTLFSLWSIVVQSQRFDLDRIAFD